MVGFEDLCIDIQDKIKYHIVAALIGTHRLGLAFWLIRTWYPEDRRAWANFMRLRHIDLWHCQDVELSELRLYFLGVKSFTSDTMLRCKTDTDALESASIPEQQYKARARQLVIDAKCGRLPHLSRTQLDQAIEETRANESDLQDYAYGLETKEIRVGAPAKGKYRVLLSIRDPSTIVQVLHTGGEPLGDISGEKDIWPYRYNHTKKFGLATSEYAMWHINVSNFKSSDDLVLKVVASPEAAYHIEVLGPAQNEEYEVIFGYQNVETPGDHEPGGYWRLSPPIDAFPIRRTGNMEPGRQLAEYLAKDDIIEFKLEYVDDDYNESPDPDPDPSWSRAVKWAGLRIPLDAAGWAKFRGRFARQDFAKLQERMEGCARILGLPPSTLPQVLVRSEYQAVFDIDSISDDRTRWIFGYKMVPCLTCMTKICQRFAPGRNPGIQALRETLRSVSRGTKLEVCDSEMYGEGHMWVGSEPDWTSVEDMRDCIFGSQALALAHSCAPMMGQENQQPRVHLVADDSDRIDEDVAEHDQTMQHSMVHEDLEYLIY